MRYFTYFNMVLTNDNQCFENMTTYNKTRIEIANIIKKKFCLLKEYSKPTEAEKKRPNQPRL